MKTIPARLQWLKANVWQLPPSGGEVKRLPVKRSPSIRVVQVDQKIRICGGKRRQKSKGADREKIGLFLRELNEALDRHSKNSRFSIDAWKEKIMFDVLAPIRESGVAMLDRYRAALGGW
jgi:hypothetical protein